MKYDPRALATGGQTREMFEIVKAGGPVMVPIILCSIVAVAIIIERLWTLRQQRVVPVELTDKVWQWVENRTLSDKQIRALELHSPLGQNPRGRYLQSPPRPRGDDRGDRGCRPARDT